MNTIESCTDIPECMTAEEIIIIIIIRRRIVEAIPVIIGATGIVEKNIKKYVGRIPSCPNIYSLQRSAILGTAHILRKVLSMKPD